MYYNVCTPKKYTYCITVYLCVSCVYSEQIVIFSKCIIRLLVTTTDVYRVALFIEFSVNSTVNRPILMLLFDVLWPLRSVLVSKSLRLDYMLYTMKHCSMFCLSPSVLPCQYYSTNALYSSSSTVARTRRTNGPVPVNLQTAMVCRKLNVL
jgi:hypothetical protein